MDQLEAPGVLGLPPKPGEEDGAKKGPGRPAQSPAARALSDEKYAQVISVLENLPKAAREPRFAVYDANSQDNKASFRPLLKILLSEWVDKGFQEEGNLEAYLEEKLGRGRYFIEPLDPHNRRIDKLAQWCVDAGEPMDPEDLTEDDRPRGRFRRERPLRRRFRDDEDDLDDEDDIDDRRANAADILATVGRAQATQAATVTRSNNDMMTVVMMSQQAAAQARAEEDRRREERQTEERRRQDEMAERRRQEERDEARREEERRRQEEAKAEERRREERQEQQRREERIEAQRREDLLARMQAENKKTELLIGAVPLLLKVLEKKEDPMMGALITRLTTPPQQDPVTTLLLKSVLDKTDRADSTQVMFQQVGEMAKLQSQLSAEQMRGLISMSNDMNKVMMQKAIEMMSSSPAGQTAEGKGMIEQIAQLMSGAGEFIKQVFPAGMPAMSPPQGRRALPHQRAALPPPQPPVHTQPGPANSVAQPQGVTGPPAPPAPQLEVAPVGVAGVLYALRSIQSKSYANNTEYQSLIQYILNQIPLDLRIAVLTDNQIGVLTLTKPAIEADPALDAWIKTEGVLSWISGYVPTLKPTLESVFGPTDVQLAQYNNLIAQGGEMAAFVKATPVEVQAELARAQAADAAGGGTPVTEAGATDAPPVPPVPPEVPTDEADMPPPVPPVPADESAPPPPVPPVPPAEGEPVAVGAPSSHLSDPDEDV